MTQIRQVTEVAIAITGVLASSSLVWEREILQIPVIVVDVTLILSDHSVNTTQVHATDYADHATDLRNIIATNVSKMPTSMKTLVKLQGNAFV